MQTFRTPFSRAYWRLATLELKNTRMWILAALITAIRIALKSVRIPIMENLYITMGFLPNALGSLIYGPILAILSAIVSDTLGALLFPVGAYFPPFALVEIMGSLIFALFLYRAPITIWRVAASKLCVNIICNILLTPIFLSWMGGTALALLSTPRIIKNMVLFPVEAILLTLLIDAMLPALKQLHLIPIEQVKLTLTPRHFVMLGVMFVLSAFVLFVFYSYNVSPVNYVQGWLQALGLVVSQ